ncbi:MAG: hypothetical protein K2J36_01750 [Ruminococcus sp.]|nr:hypothetical protein [Ruminococcus sp.]
MSWIWQDYSKDKKYINDLFFDVFSECYDFNGETHTNVFRRFETIFRDLRVITEKQGLFNVMVHFLAQQDRLNGLDFDELMCNVLAEEINRGAFGNEVKELINSDCIDDNERRYIIFNLYEYKISGERTSPFEEMLLYLFRNSDFEDFTECFGLSVKFRKKENIPDGVNNFSVSENKDLFRVKSYPETYYRRSNDTNYYYCGKKTQKKENKFRLIKLLFADVTENIEPIWDNCFGIIGAEDDECASPVIDGIQIL